MENLLALFLMAVYWFFGTLWGWITSITLVEILLFCILVYAQKIMVEQHNNLLFISNQLKALKFFSSDNLTKNDKTFSDYYRSLIGRINTIEAHCEGIRDNTDTIEDHCSEISDNTDPQQE